VQGDFRIGAWLIQPQLHTIARNGEVTHVEPKAMRVLVYLAEHADQVVPKERLISAVWADTFVTDDVLTRCISELRKAFDDDAKDPKVIETIPRGGYRLVAPVWAPEETEAAATTNPQPRAVLSRAGIRAVVTFLLLLGAVAVYWTRFSPRAHPPAGRIMLAVLPFQNLSGDPEQEYFSDGLTAEMISQLGRLPPERLGVIARTSAIQYKNTKKSAAEIGRELGADYLVEGSVQRAGERVRIRTELVQARDQTHLWADTYERNLRDVLALQAEVANAIAGEIRIKLTPPEEARLASARPLNPQAHEAYLRALYSFYQGRNQGNSELYNRYFSQSIEQYQEAIRLDPSYPQAYAGLARAYHWLASGLDVQQPDLPAKSRQAAEKALALDDRLGEAHASLGYVAFRFEWDFPRAEQEFRRAIELNPN
jgi:TolB-like protein/DNA-binding winged helix-turn-helix (wHTH) protein